MPSRLDGHEWELRSVIVEVQLPDLAELLLVPGAALQVAHGAGRRQRRDEDRQQHHDDADRHCHLDEAESHLPDGARHVGIIVPPGRAARTRGPGAATAPPRRGARRPWR